MVEGLGLYIDIVMDAFTKIRQQGKDAQAVVSVLVILLNNIKMLAYGMLGVILFKFQF